MTPHWLTAGCVSVPPSLPTGIQAILYFIFGNNMIALAFLLSCFFTSSKTATVFAYLIVFGTGLIGSLLLSQLINAGQWYTTLLQLVPSFALFRCDAAAACRQRARLAGRCERRAWLVGGECTSLAYTCLPACLPCCTCLPAGACLRWVSTLSWPCTAPATACRGRTWAPRATAWLAPGSSWAWSGCCSWGSPGTWSRWVGVRCWCATCCACT